MRPGFAALLAACIATLVANDATATPIILPARQALGADDRASLYLIPPDGARACIAQFAADGHTTGAYRISLGGPSRRLRWTMARTGRGSLAIYVSCGTDARHPTSLGTARRTFALARSGRRRGRTLLRRGSWRVSAGWIPKGPPAFKGSRARAADVTEANTSVARTCSSPYMTKAYAVGQGYGARMGFVPRTPAHDNPNVDKIWKALLECVRYPNLTGSQADSVFKQMVCHVIYGALPGAGSSWDFEAWRTDPSWATALWPGHDCQKWGNVAITVAGAQFNGQILNGSLDFAQQKHAWLVLRMPDGDFVREHVLTTKAFGCLKALGAPGPVVVASGFLTDELPILGDAGDEWCTGAATVPLSVAGSPTVTLTQGPAALPSGYRYGVALSGFGPRSVVSVTCYDSASPGGFYSFHLTTDASGAAFTSSYCYSGDGPDHWVIAGGVASNHVAWGGSSPPPPPAPTWAEQETPNHPVNTFLNYHNASGVGQAIPAGTWVQVSCKVYDPTIGSVNPDGYWYRIASAPWSNIYYAPANTFMNGDTYGGPYTHNTDFAVANC